LIFSAILSLAEVVEGKEILECMLDRTR